MKNGLRIYDADTHVEPSAEVIDKYVDPGFRPRLDELAPYRFPVRAGSPGSSPGRHVYRYGQISYKRILGEAAPRETHSGRDTHWMGSKQPRPGVQDDAAESRVRDMDDEGTDTHFLIPTSLDHPAGTMQLVMPHAVTTTGALHAAGADPPDIAARDPVRQDAPLVDDATVLHQRSGHW